MTERTLVLLKPDAVQRLLVGPILGRFEARGLKIVGLKLVAVSRELAGRHYAVHREKPFFGELVAWSRATTSRTPGIPSTSARAPRPQPGWWRATTTSSVRDQVARAAR